MVITCEECSTRFQLDDTRVPEGGVRVRCSRCKHAFFVKPPALPDDTPVERAVEQALADEPSDLPASADAAPAERAAAGGELREGEADWEFNHDPDHGHDAALAEARDVVDELLSVGAVEDAEAAAKADFFGSADDVDEDIDALLGGAEPEPEPAHVSAAPTAHVAEQADAPDPLETRAEDELGSPDEWNFFADEADAGAASGRASLVAPALLASFDASLAAREELPEIDSEPSPTALRLARAGAALGWVATAALCAALLAFGLLPEPLAQVAGTASGAGLDLVDVRTRSIDNFAAGEIQVIEGSFVSKNGTRRGPGARFAVRLLDANDGLLVDDAATLGPPLATSALRETAPARLRETLAREAVAAAWLPVAPGAVWPFQAVVAELPAAAARFEIVPVPVDAPTSIAAPAEDPSTLP